MIVFNSKSFFKVGGADLPARLVTWKPKTPLGVGSSKQPVQKNNLQTDLFLFLLQVMSWPFSLLKDDFSPFVPGFGISQGPKTPVAGTPPLRFSKAMRTAWPIASCTRASL